MVSILTTYKIICILKVYLQTKALFALFVLEVELVEECIDLLSNITMHDDANDIWIWEFNIEDLFSVKEDYALVSNFEIESDSPLFRVNWTNLISLKILLYTLRLLNNRLTTQINLIHRGVQNLTSHMCVEWCNLNKTSKNLFFRYPIMG